MTNAILKNETSDLSELSEHELDQVSGGFLPLLAAAGVGAVGQGVVLGFMVIGTVVAGVLIGEAVAKAIK